MSNSGPDEGLIGILNTARDGALDGAAVLLLNAGVIHRSGPARLNQKIACGLATFGIPSLRFDFSGIGDSTLRCDTSLRQRFVSDTQGAMDYLQRRGVRRFVLLGLCYGAVIAFETALCDWRVAGLVLINGQGYLFYAQQKAKSNLRTQVDLRYYLWRALRSETWLRVFSLKLDYWGFVRTVMHRLGSAFETSNAADPEVARIRNGFDWLQRVAVLMVYAASDPGTGGSGTTAFCALASGMSAQGIRTADRRACRPFVYAARTPGCPSTSRIVLDQSACGRRELFPL